MRQASGGLSVQSFFIVSGFYMALVLERNYSDRSLFHSTGMPNKLTSRRDLPQEVAIRLQRAGSVTGMNGDGVLAIRSASRH